MFDDNKKLAKAIGGVRQCVGEGKSVYEGMKEYAVFPEIFWKLVEVGELTGALDQILHRYASAIMEHEE